PSSTPVLTVPGEQFARFGKALSFQVKGVDSSGLPVELMAAGIPRGAVFEPLSGRFEWIPDVSDAGTHQINFTATNADRRSSSARVTLNVDSGAPVLTEGRGSVCSPGAIGTLAG